MSLFKSKRKDRVFRVGKVRFRTIHHLLCGHYEVIDDLLEFPVYDNSKDLENGVNLTWLANKKVVGVQVGTKAWTAHLIVRVHLDKKDLRHIERGEDIHRKKVTYGGKNQK